MHIFCKTDFALFLAAFSDAKGVIRCPQSKESPLPGLIVVPKALTPINEQLISSALTSVTQNDISSVKTYIYQEFAETIEYNNKSYTLYLGKIDGVVANDSWPTFPAMLRSMEPNKRRSYYLKAFQVLAGGLDLDTKAVELSLEDIRNLQH